MNDIREKVISSLFWRFAERMGAQGISFIVSIVLARLLEPEYYGTVALVNVFTNILQVFVDSGMANALIQKRDADELDFSTVFYFNMIMCTILYVGIFFAAPFIADFYNDPALISIVRVISLTLIVSGLKNVQQAYVSRLMLFKRFFYSTLGGTIFSAILGITLAYKGFGVWALVFQQLSNLVIDTLILWITVKWRPKKLFSISRFKRLFSFGWKLLVSGLLDTVYTNLQSLIIGKKYTSEDLAYYNNGQKIPNIVVTNINTSIGSVLLPTLSKEQGDPDLVKAHMRRSIQVSSYILWPIMLGVAACSNSIIHLLLTDKWLPSVPYLQIACIYYALMPIHTSNLQAITAMGRSDLFLKLEIIKKIVGVIALIISVQFGVLAIALSSILTGIISTIINAWPNRKLLGYNYIEQIKDIAPSFLLSSVMAMIVWEVDHISIFSNDILNLLVQIVLGGLIYILGSKFFHLESYEYIMNYLKKF